MSGQSFSLVTPPPPRRGTSRRSSLSPSTTASDVPWAGERHGGRKPLRSEFWGKCWEEKKGRVFEGRKEKSCEDQRQRRQESKAIERARPLSLSLHYRDPSPRIPPPSPRASSSSTAPTPRSSTEEKMRASAPRLSSGGVAARCSAFARPAVAARQRVSVVAAAKSSLSSSASVSTTGLVAARRR